MTSPTWDNAAKPARQKIVFAGWIRAFFRGLPLAVLVFGGLLAFLLTRTIERVVSKPHTPWTPHITVFVCRNALRLLRLPVSVHGAQPIAFGGVVANHSSWLDIFVLNSIQPLRFVSKAEVSKWPGIGWLARATNTVFIQRDPRQAQVQKDVLQERLKRGHKLLFFPEGTSSDGQQVLPFKSSLFAAFMGDGSGDRSSIQAISVVYHAPEHADPRFYGWWGDMGFAEHLLDTLAAQKQGRVDVMLHAALDVADIPDRKALASCLEAQVRQGHSALLQTNKNGLQ